MLEHYTSNPGVTITGDIQPPISGEWYTFTGNIGGSGTFKPPTPSLLEQLSKKVETDPSGGSLNAPGKKGDAGKIQAWLFTAGFSRALREVAKITTLGANKYTPNGWASVPNGSERYMEAFGRHMFDLGEGKIFDTDLGPDVYNKASMIWNLLASLELDLRAK